MKTLKQHLAEYELLRRALSGEEGQIDQSLINKAAQGWALSGHRRLKEIDAAIREAREALNGAGPRFVEWERYRAVRRRGGAHLRKRVRA